MITVTVTSDSSVPELHIATRAIEQLTQYRLTCEQVNKALVDDEVKVPPPPSRKTDLTVKLDASDAIKEIEKVRDEIAEQLRGTNPTHVIVDEINERFNHDADIKLKKDLDNHYVNSTSPIKDPVGIFNATELAEAETMGKPACSTVDASQSTTAHVDTQVNTSLPEPTSVFGQAAQTTVNEANRAVPTTVNPVTDADGLPWDSRIHSSSKEVVKNGTWRKRRGVDDALVRSVEAELRGKPVTTATEPVISTVTQTSAPVSVEQAQNWVDKVTQAEVVTPIGEQYELVSGNISNEGEVTFNTPATTEMTFTELLDGVTKAMVAGQLSQERINGALATVGLTALPNLLGNPALIPEFRQALGGVV